MSQPLAVPTGAVPCRFVLLSRRFARSVYAAVSCRVIPMCWVGLQIGCSSRSWMGGVASGPRRWLPQARHDPQPSTQASTATGPRVAGSKPPAASTRSAQVADFDTHILDSLIELLGLLRLDLRPGDERGDR